jgi:predicted O-methyltransferase YrrM
VIIKLLSRIKEKSVHDNVPIVRERTIEYIQKYIIDHKYTSYLEIGTAYGYSAAQIERVESVNKIVSVEKNEHNYKIAKNFLFKSTRITLVNEDAFLYEPKETFDVIFLDGPKSHQDVLLEKYAKYLNNDGIIFIDNMFLKKFDHYKVLSKNNLALIKKNKEFND